LLPLCHIGLALSAMASHVLPTLALLAILGACWVTVWGVPRIF
jgi:hypothetical protein